MELFFLINGKNGFNRLQVFHRCCSSPKDAILNDSTVFKMFTSITSKIPDQMEEFGLMNVLTQSLNCHGFLNKSSKLASMLAQRILSTYPEKLRMGEHNFRSLTERANNICEILLNTEEYERIAFQIAMLGLTAPRLPARSNLEEVEPFASFLAGIYLLKVNNNNTRARSEICSKFTIKTPKRREWRCSGALIVNFVHISQLVLVFLLLTLNMKLLS